jgi:hypothetical protein
LPAKHAKGREIPELRSGVTTKDTKHTKRTDPDLCPRITRIGANGSDSDPVNHETPEHQGLRIFTTDYTDTTDGFAKTLIVIARRTQAGAAIHLEGDGASKDGLPRQPVGLPRNDNLAGSIRVIRGKRRPDSGFSVLSRDSRAN